MKSPCQCPCGRRTIARQLENHKKCATCVEFARFWSILRFTVATVGPKPGLSLAELKQACRILKIEVAP